MLLGSGFLLFSFASTAQFQQGEKVLGAGFSAQSLSNENNSFSIPQKTTSSGFNLSAELGFVSRANQLNGFFINGGYGVTKNEYPTQPSTNSKGDNYNMGAGFFTRRYKALGKQFYLFGEGRAGVNFARQNQPGGSLYDGKSYNISVGLFPGLSYRVTNRFLLDLRLADLISLGYSHQETNIPNNQKNKQNNFYLNSSLGLGYLRDIGIGARWVIAAKKK